MAKARYLVVLIACLVAILAVSTTVNAGETDPLVRVVNVDADSVRPDVWHRPSRQDFLRGRWRTWREAWRPYHAVRGHFWWSRAGHGPTDIVRYYMTLDKQTRIRGVHLNWVFSPGEIQVETSHDNGASWVEAVAWRPSPRGEQQFAEDVFFPYPKWANRVRVNMRGPRFGSFGLRGLAVYRAGMNCVMLKSGTASDDEMCLTVPDGNIDAVGTPVTLASCLEGMAKGDGRELWKLGANGQIKTLTGKCLGLAGSGADDVRAQTKLQIENCKWDAMRGGMSDKNWVTDISNAIKQATNPRLVMAVAGGGSGSQDVGERKPAEATSTYDAEHGADKAMDVSGQSYWASQPGAKDVTFTVRLGEKKALSSAKIEWKWPAKHYTIDISNDGGNSWQTIVDQSDFNSAVSDHKLQSKQAEIVRIHMLEQHETLGKFNDMLLYGIASFKIFASSGEIVVMDIDQAAASGDGRDKWYIEDVTDCDTGTQKRLEQLIRELDAAKNRLVQCDAFVMQLGPDIDKALAKGADLRKRMDDTTANLVALDLKLHAWVEQHKPATQEAESTTDDLGPSVHPGLGATSKNPALDCHTIKKLEPDKPNGYFWIKPDCAPAPLRVFCDFTSEGGGWSYYFFNGGRPMNQPINNIVPDVKTARRRCAEVGLELVRVRSYDMLTMIRAFIWNVGMSPWGRVVPIAYDYLCDEGQCTWNHRMTDLTGPGGADVSRDVRRLVDPHRPWFASWTDFRKGPNTIGFGNSWSSLTYFRWGKAPIGGLVCSTNKDGSEPQLPHVVVDCDTVLKGNEQFNGVPNTNIIAKCPAGCGDRPNEIWGTSLYAPQSAVCKAAIHAGALDSDESGFVEVGIEGPQDEFKGSKQNNIVSKELAEESDRAFIVNPVHKVCPIDAFLAAEKAASMVETDSTSLSSTASSSEASEGSTSLAGSRLDDQLSLSPSDYASAAGSPEPDFSFSDLSAAEASSMFDDQASLSPSDQRPPLYVPPTGSPKFEYSFLEAGSQVAMGLGAGNDDENQYSESTQAAVGKVRDIVENNKPELDDDTEALAKATKDTADANGKMKPLFEGDTGIPTFMEELKNLEAQLDTTQKLMQASLAQAQGELKTEQQKLYVLAAEKAKIQKFEPFAEDYKLPIDVVWEVRDTPKAAQGPSQWSYSNHAVNGVQNTIAQLSNIYVDNEKGFGSHLKLRYKEYYDANVTLRVLSNDNDLFGVAFRYKDPYNYYVFDMVAQGRGFKRIRKCVNGEMKTLVQKFDGGYMQGHWYDVAIEYRQTAIKVVVKQDNPAFEVVLTADDSDVVRGSIALMVNADDGAYFADIKATPIPCAKPQPPPLVPIPPQCSRFKESYYGQISTRWIVKDPEDNDNGPSSWKFAKQIGGRPNVIFQKSCMVGTGPDKVGSLLVLGTNDVKQPFPRICKDGMLRAEVYAFGDGIMGIAFRYKDEKNHYIFEIGGEKDGYKQLRKVVNGRYSVVGTRQEGGYTKNKWYGVKIVFKGSNIKIYLGDPSSILPEVMSVDDGDLKEGSIALSSYDTCGAAFDNVRMEPPPVLAEDTKSFSSKAKQKLAERILGKSGLPATPEAAKELEALSEAVPGTLAALMGGDKSTVRTNANALSNLAGVRFSGGLSWSDCLKYPKPEDRKKYCDINYKGSLEEHAACTDNFCSLCCDKMLSKLTHPIKFYTCEKQCRGSQQPSSSDSLWKTCITPTRPENSVYRFCSTMESERQKENCHIDFCHLCCTTADQAKGVPISDDSIERCHMACLDAFGSASKQVQPM